MRFSVSAVSYQIIKLLAMILWRPLLSLSDLNIKKAEDGGRALMEPMSVAGTKVREFMQTHRELQARLGWVDKPKPVPGM